MPDPTLMRLREQLTQIKRDAEREPPSSARVQVSRLVGGVDEALDMIDDAIRDKFAPRVADVAAGGQIHFWQYVANEYPQAEGGDLDVRASVAFMEACERAVRAWLAANRPEPTHDQLTRLATMLHEASVGGNGVTMALTAELACDSTLNTRGQNTKHIDGRDLLVVVAAHDDLNSESPGTERTFVTVIAPDGRVKDSWEVR